VKLYNLNIAVIGVLLGPYKKVTGLIQYSNNNDY